MNWQGLCSLKLCNQSCLLPQRDAGGTSPLLVAAWVVGHSGISHSEEKLPCFAISVPFHPFCCHVLPYLCHPLPLATLPDSVGLIFLLQSQWSEFDASGRLSQSLAAPGLSSIILRIIWQQGQAWEHWKSCSVQVCSWVRMWPPLCAAVCRTHTLPVNNQTGFVPWL